MRNVTRYLTSAVEHRTAVLVGGLATLTCIAVSACAPTDQAPSEITGPSQLRHEQTASASESARSGITKQITPYPIAIYKRVYVSASNFRYPCFGYTGSFKGGTHILKVDWQTDGTDDECFGIAPDRSIWHAWRNSGAWQAMPHGGRADDTFSAYYDYPDGNRVVEVHVNCSGTWTSTYRNGAWQPWRQKIVEYCH